MPLTEMEQCIQTILKHFHESAGQEGNYDTLNKAELKGFITRCFPNYMKVRDTFFIKEWALVLFEEELE